MSRYRQTVVKYQMLSCPLSSTFLIVALVRAVRLTVLFGGVG